MSQVGRTTIIIAHRLTTVVSAAKIAAVYRGRVLEQVNVCTHEQSRLCSAHSINQFLTFAGFPCRIDGFGSILRIFG